jgi:ABC-type branched-subunit amino acid transport system substrate-binding protein
VYEQGGSTLRKLKSAVVVAVAVATMASVALVAHPLGAQTTTAGSKDLHIIGAYEVKGESPLGMNTFDDGAKLAVKELEKQGWNVQYERIPASATSAASQEQAWLQVQQKQPDAWLGLTSSNVFVPVGSKIAATDQPTFALASPSEGVKTGSAGGDNIFVVRPLNEQTYSKLLEYVCTDLKKQLKLKDVKIALNLVTTSFGPTVENTVKREIGNYKNCKVVNTTTNALNATDMTEQVLSIKDSGANVILSANFPAPSGVLVNQLRQNGVTTPFVGGASMNLAIDANSVQSLDNVWASDDCVPELEKDAQAKKFVKAFTKEYGSAPNYASAQVYDTFHIVANAVAKAGHDQKAIDKALAATDYNGVCDLRNDNNNVLGRSVTIYKYAGPTDKKKVLVKKVDVDFVPNAELGAPTTTAAPTTTTAAP